MRARLRARRPRRRTRLLILVAVVSAGLLSAAQAPAAAGQPAAGPFAAPIPPVTECGGLAEVAPPNTTVVEASQDPGDATTPASCRLTLHVADPQDSGVVTVWVYLPVTTWNGRFQATGGGGFSGGDPENLLEPLRAGYATAATDAGHEGAEASFALNPDGTLNWPGIEDYGHEGIQDMTVAAKAMIRAYYGQDPAYSYFNGCSTGGRQGIMEAQRHPEEYDGILAGAPVINFPEMQTGQIWGQVVMLQEGNFIPACKFEAAVTAMVAACDTGADGVADGVIGDPLGCGFDLSTLVGQETPCGVISAADVAVMRRIQEGPRRQTGEFLWYGLAPGAPFAGLHDTVEVDGELAGAPFVFDVWWFSYWLAQDPDFDWTTLTYESFEDSFDLAVERFDDVTGAADPDLSAFHKAGGKLLTWHGAGDFGVMFQGTVDYYERVRDTLGAGRAREFLRLFLAPGVGHCGGGTGPQLTDPFAALVEWVEHGTAPSTLAAASTTEAGTVTATRPVCEYPTVARWTGKGDPADAANYKCAPATKLRLPKT